MQNFGMGSHFDTLPPDDVRSFMKHFYIGTITYPLTLTFIKLALLVQYLRIFGQDSRRRLLCKWLIGLISVWGLVYSIPTWVPCYPVASMWDFTVRSRHCWGYFSFDPAQALGFYISHSVTTTLLDLVVMALPATLVLRRNTQKKTRIALMCLFVLGLAYVFPFGLDGFFCGGGKL